MPRRVIVILPGLCNHENKIIRFLGGINQTIFEFMFLWLQGNLVLIIMRYIIIDHPANANAYLC